MPCSRSTSSASSSPRAGPWPSSAPRCSWSSCACPGPRARHSTCSRPRTPASTGSQPRAMRRHPMTHRVASTTLRRDERGSTRSRAAVPSPSRRPSPRCSLPSGRNRAARSTTTAFGSPCSPATSSPSRSPGARLREALEHERHELGAIVDGATDLILQVDAENRVVRLNPAGERLLGTTAAEALGRPCADVLGCEVAGGHGAKDCPLAEVRASGDPIAYRETAVRGGTGSPVRVAGSYAAAAVGRWPGHPDDGDPARSQRGEDPRGAARGVRGHRQPRAAHPAGAHPRLRRDPPPPRARA